MIALHLTVFPIHIIGIGFTQHHVHAAEVGPNTHPEQQKCQHVTLVFRKFVKEDALFVTREGHAFKEGTPGRRVIAWWKKATGLDNSSTMLRKIGCSQSMEEDLPMQEAVHVIMTHRQGTTLDHYTILKKSKQAVKGHAALAKNLGLADSVETINPDESDNSNEESAMKKLRKSAQSVASVKSNVTQKTTGKSPLKLSPVGVQSPCKSGLSTEQLEDIDLLFSNIITTNASVTSTEVKNIMSENIHDFHNGRRCTDLETILHANKARKASQKRKQSVYEGTFGFLRRQYLQLRSIPV